MAETIMWQSASGATARAVVTLQDLPRPILWNDDRNPWEKQPAASYSPEPDAEAVVPWRLAFEKWRDYIRDRLSPSTCANYSRDVEKTLAAIGKADLRAVTWDDLYTYWREYVARNGPRKPATYNRWVASIQSFYRYCVDKLDLPIKDLGRKLDPMPTEKVLRLKTTHTPLTKDEFQAILRVAEAHGDLRWSLAARFKWTAICRLEDVWSLTWAQLDLGPKPKATYPRPSKHGVNLTKLIDPGLAKRLLEWKRMRPEDPVFRDAATTKKVYRDWFARRLKKYAAEAGLLKYAHPHLVRASARTHGRSQHVPTEFLNRQGGWVVRDASDAYDREDPETYRQWVRYLALD